MSEKLCLHWNNFQENVKRAFENLREGQWLFWCGGGGTQSYFGSIKSFFPEAAWKKQASTSIIYMRGIKSVDMLAIVDFLYCGEANVHQENLDRPMDRSAHPSIDPFHLLSSTFIHFHPFIHVIHFHPFQPLSSPFIHFRPHFSI